MSDRLKAAEVAYLAAHKANEESGGLKYRALSDAIDALTAERRRAERIRMAREAIEDADEIAGSGQDTQAMRVALASAFLEEALRSNPMRHIIEASDPVHDEVD